MKKGTKISVYQAVVLTTLLYSSESWVTYRHYLRFLKRFHQRCHRTVFKIQMRNYVYNAEILDQAEITSRDAMLLKSELHWLGHISRMGGHCLPKIALYGDLSSGHRDKEEPRKGFKDFLETTLGTCSGRHLLLTVRRFTVNQLIFTFEDSCKANIREKHRMKKIRETSAADKTSYCSRRDRT